MRISILAGLCSAALLIATNGPASGQNANLTAAERQFVDALDKGDMEKANFYASEGFVDPANLSTGKSLESYLYGGWGCKDWQSGNCTPALDGAIFVLGMGIHVNKPIREGKRPMTYVCWGNYVGVNNSRLLIERGADVEFFDNDGFTPLHYCVTRSHGTYGGSRSSWDDHRAVMDNLINAGAGVNRRSTSLVAGRHVSYREMYGTANTPLMMAVDYMGLIDNRDWNTIEYLIEKGADATAIDGNGFAVANYIAYPDRNRKYQPTLDLLTLLHKAGADIMHTTPNGKNLYTLAVDKGELEFAMQIRAISETPR